MLSVAAQRVPGPSFSDAPLCFHLRSSLFLPPFPQSSFFLIMYLWMELFRKVSFAQGATLWHLLLPRAWKHSVPTRHVGVGGWVHWRQSRTRSCQKHCFFLYSNLPWGLSHKTRCNYMWWPSLYLTNPMASPFSCLPFGSQKKKCPVSLITFPSPFWSEYNFLSLGSWALFKSRHSVDISCPWP